MTPPATPSPRAGPGREEPYGAAPERTRLSWQRTGVGVVVGFLVVSHTSARLDAIVAAGLAVGLGLLVAAVGVFAAPAADRPGSPWRWLCLLVAAVVSLGLLGAAVGVLEALTG